MYLLLARSGHKVEKFFETFYIINEIKHRTMKLVNKIKTNRNKIKYIILLGNQKNVRYLGILV